jgi:hypothetical protein
LPARSGVRAGGNCTGQDDRSHARGGDARGGRRHPEGSISPASSARSGGGFRRGREARSRCHRAGRPAPR